MRHSKDHITAASSFLRHALFYLRVPAGGINRFLQIHPGEGRMLAWATLLQIVMSFNAILVNNVAQTAFLKRFGAHALPMVFMAEAGITFLCTLLVGLLMERFRKIRVFSALLLFYGLSMCLVRIMIPMGISLSYPLLYILKSQAVGILPILYWDILNDMFTSRQSKRLYTLISAGGVLGIMVGSLLTHRIAAWIGFDNILMLFACGMALTAVLNEMTEKVTGVPLQARISGSAATPGQGVKALFKDFAGQYRESALLKYMILLIAIPNVLLPFLDFQFNVLVDRHFASETGTLAFFGYFRGVSNGLMFLLLLVSGRVISKWGVPVSLLFHPANYFLSFLAIFLRFDLIAGVYARLSTETLKTVLNNPARAVLYNFFPEQRRSMIRLVLRGGVVRVSDFAGSALLIALTAAADPRLISLIALPLALAWWIAAFGLKKAYPDILIQSLKNGQLQWDKTGEETLTLLAKDRQAIRSFRHGLDSEADNIALLSAEMLARVRPDLLMESLLPVISQKPPQVQKGWLNLVPAENAARYLPILYQKAESAPETTLPIWLEFLNRVDPENSGLFMERYINHPNPDIQAEAFVGACIGCSLENQDAYRHQMKDWLSGDLFHIILALKVLSRKGDLTYEQAVLDIDRSTADPAVQDLALQSLSAMGSAQAVPRALARSGAAHPDVRQSALLVLAASEPEVRAEHLIRFLKDPEPAVRSRAFHFISQRGKAVLPDLLKTLAGHSTVQQMETVRLLKFIGAPPAELSRFVLARLHEALNTLACIHILAGAGEGTAAWLLKKALEEDHQQIIELILRVLGMVEFSDKMPFILQAVQSGRRQDVDNAIEAIQTALHTRLRHALIPHLENRPLADRLSDSAGAMGIKPPFFAHFSQMATGLLAQSMDPFMKALCLYAASDDPSSALPPAILQPLTRDPDPQVAAAAAFAMKARNPDEKRHESPQKPAELVEKTIYLKTSPFFREMRVRELLRAAERCRLKETGKGDVVVPEGKPSPGIYLLCQGKFSTEGRAGSACREPITKDMAACGVAGEMPWIDGGGQLMTVRCVTEGLLLEMPGELFRRLLEESPGLALTACRFYSRRILAYQNILPQP